MATNPVTRKLAFNTMTLEPVGARRPPVDPDGQVALHYTHFIIFAQRMHLTNHTLDDHMWVATLEEIWGVDLWPALFTQAGEPELSTMTQLSEMIRTNLLQKMEAEARQSTSTEPWKYLWALSSTVSATRMTPTVPAFLNCTNLQIRIARHALT
eukprot:4481532-Pleurochrysis_carterae.AAC.1